MKRSFAGFALFMMLVGCQGVGVGKDDEGDGKKPYWSKFVTFVSSDVAFNAADKADSERVGAQALALNEFSFEMFHKLHDVGSLADEANFLFSPLSVRTAFAMVYSGAEAGGDVQKEMASALRYEGDELTLHHELKSQILGIQDSFTTANKKQELEWSLGNQVFVDKSMGLQPAYLNVLKANYNAGVGKVDFRSSDSSLEKSRLAINDFVSEKTRHLVKDLMPKAALTRDSALVLVNTIYMLADWETPFKKESTNPLPFTTARGETITTKTMMQKGMFGYYGFGDDSLQALSKSYAGGSVAMLWIVPKQGVERGQVESSLSAERFAQIVNGLQSTEVELELPKFAMEWGTESLKKGLQEMGMKTPFDDGGNRFPRILSDRSGAPLASEAVWIQDVLHKAKIVVDEKGTEAAAATAITVGETLSAPAPILPVSFKVDRPSLFFIYDVKTKSILFMGRLADPR
jgi:serpin B